MVCLLVSSIDPDLVMVLAVCGWGGDGSGDIDTGLSPRACLGGERRTAASRWTDDQNEIGIPFFPRMPMTDSKITKKARITAHQSSLIFKTGGCFFISDGSDLFSRFIFSPVWRRFTTEPDR